MTTPKLTADCLEEIFEHLKNDQSSLFSCLLVNRLWCRLVIHLVWRDPFAVNLSDKFLSNIVDTYISCLPDTSKQQIIDKISGTNEKTEDNQEEKKKNNNNFKFQQRPLFVYLKFLQNLDLEEFGKALRIWHKKHDKSYDENIPDYAISKLLIDFIFKECSILTRLNIFVWDKWGIPLNDMNFNLLFNRENGDNVLINLKIFKFTFATKEKFERLKNFHQIVIDLFKNIEKNSINIQSLEVSFRMHRPPNEVDQAVGNLIKAQKNLKSCKIIEYWDPKKPIIYYILMNNNSLTSLNLSLTYFHESFVEGLSNCKNLETLELSKCPEMPSHLLDEPPKGSLSIKYLKVDMTNHLHSCSESLVTLLRMCNINLRKLFVDGADASVIDAIHSYNSKLTHLSINAHNQIFDPPQSLSTLEDLTHLKLGKYKTHIFVDHTLPYFIESLPPNLRHLYLNFDIDSNSLETFLKECKIPLKSLEIHQSRYAHNQDVIFQSLINYKKLNQDTCEELRLITGSAFPQSNGLKEVMKYIKIISDPLPNYDLW